MPPAIDQPENQREHDADDDRCGQRKVNNRIFAAIGDFTGKTAKRKIEPSGQQQHSANQNNDPAEHEQQLAYICHEDILAARRTWPRLARIKTNR